MKTTKRKSPPRLSVIVPENELEKFAYLCKMKNFVQTRLINNWINQFTDKYWTDEIDKHYKQEKEIKNHDQNIRTMQPRNK